MRVLNPGPTSMSTFQGKDNTKALKVKYKEEMWDQNNTSNIRLDDIRALNQDSVWRHYSG